MTPDSYTNQELYLSVGEGHELYIHDWGNAKAKVPIMFVNGGPGLGSKDRYKLNFDPKKQRVIFFDQRGSGKSIPKAELKGNTTDHLASDMVKILDKLGIPQVVLTGGSWGSCLSLVFGIRYPTRVKAMVLNGIYTASQSETDHLDKGGFKTYFPDIWDNYVATVPTAHRKDPSKYHYHQVKGDDPEAAKRSAYAYSEYLEGPLLKLDDRFERADYNDFDPDPMYIEMHYLANNCFLPEGYIFDNANKLTMPIYFIQGRYDMVCPPVTAYELSQKLPNCRLVWTVSGHSIERESWTAICLVQSLLSG